MTYDTEYDPKRRINCPPVDPVTHGYGLDEKLVDYQEIKDRLMALHRLITKQDVRDVLWDLQIKRRYMKIIKKGLRDWLRQYNGSILHNHPNWSPHHLPNYHHGPNFRTQIKEWDFKPLTGE